MKITRLQLHSIAIADPPLRSSYGLHAPWALRTIVELTTDDGITGVSETYGGDGPRAALEGAREHVIGMDPFRLTGFFQRLNTGGDAAEAQTGDRSQTWLVPGENPLDQNNRTFAAIEIACVDIIGKAVGKPVCDLLGGRMRDRVPFSAYLFYKHAGGGGGDGQYADRYGEVLSAKAAVRECRDMVDEYGFKEVKLKAGVLEPAVEIETLRELRAEFGARVPLRIDPNCAWSIDTSVHVGESLREALSDGGYLEDPCPGLEGMSEVRRLLTKGMDIPLASNVAVTGFPDVPKARDLQAVQIVLSDPHYWGGLRQVQYLSHLCQVLGLGMSMHSNSHLGVSLMAMTHVAAACPHLTHACDTHYPWQTEQDEIVEGGRIRFQEGTVVIPDKPGLGVELDRDQLARGCERYEKIPLRKRDDEAEMRQHVDANWRRVLPRW